MHRVYPRSTVQVTLRSATRRPVFEGQDAARPKAEPRWGGSAINEVFDKTSEAIDIASVETSDFGNHVQVLAVCSGLPNGRLPLAARTGGD